MVEYIPLNITNWINENFKDQTEEVKEVRAVGQFGESTLLLAWSSSPLKPKIQDDSASAITYIGLYDIRTPSIKVVMQFSGSAEIVFAAINQDLNIIALVTEENNKEKNKKTYQAHIRRCSPQDSGESCLFLTDAHDNQIQVQFISDPQDVQVATEGYSTFMTTLLVLIHQHSIQIHHFQVQNKQLIPLGSQTVLCLQFLWCQWSPSQLCLTFLHQWGALSNACMPSGRAYGAPPTPEEELMLSCVQFCNRDSFRAVFSIPAHTFGISKPTSSCCASGEFFLNKLSVLRLNLEVILWREGNVCICYQPYPEEPSSSMRNNFTPVLSDIEDSEFCNTPEYIITLLHHGVQFRAQTMLDNPFSAWPIHFSMIQDHQLLVLSSRGPVHVLDTDPSHRIGFQIFIPEYFWPSHLQGSISIISMPNVGAGSSVILNCDPNLCGVSLALNQDELVSLFCTTQIATNRKSIMHYFATHSNEVNGLRKLLSAMSNDVWSQEITELLTEYLLGSTYSRLKRSGISCHPILYHLPLSEKSDEKCSWLKVEYLNTYLDLDSLISKPNVPVSSSWSSPHAESGHKEGLNEFWHWLWHHQVALHRLQVTDPEATGFRMDTVASVLESVLNEDMPVEALSDESSSVIRTPIGFADLCSLCMRNKSSSGLSLPPDISHVPSDTFLPFPAVMGDFVQREKICSAVWSKLRSYLQHCCPLSSAVIINKICSDYILAQLHQSNVVCSLIFTIFGIIVDDQKPKYYFLRTLNFSRLKNLHSLLERFFVSCRRWAFPLPPGLNAVMALTAYSSMHFLIFMQHVQLGAVTLQYESVLHLVQVLDDGPENLKRKLNLIGNLSKEDGEAVLRQWNQPIGDKYRARRRARELLTSKDGAPDVHQVSEHDTEHDGTFPVEAEFAVEA